MEIDRPIFIVGTGRCGSTILTRMLAEHPHLAFLTTASNVLPGHPVIQKLMLKIWDKPIIGPLLRLRVIAGEGWNYWDMFIPGFSRSYRDFYATDITSLQKRTIKNEMERLLSKKRNRLMFKFTGWTRIGFIKEVFPDAKIVHITRDPRAVVNSMLHVDFWSGRLGPCHLNWGYLTPEELTIWNSFDQSFIALAVIEYKKVLTAYRQSIDKLSDEYKNDIIDISYCNLCNNHEKVLNQVVDFCNLEKHPRFIKSLSKYNLTSQNDKWKSSFTYQQQEILEAAIKEMDLNIYDGY